MGERGGKRGLTCTVHHYVSFRIGECREKGEESWDRWVVSVVSAVLEGNWGERMEWIGREAESRGGDEKGG